MKKFVSVILTSAMAISFAGCTSQPEETVTEPVATTESVTEDTSAATGKEDPSYTLQDIKLTESERSWSNPEDKYSEILDLYGDLTTTGTLVIATDDDILYLYAENQVEKDGKTLESQDTVYDMASVSKTVTAVALLQLAEQGKVSLDDTLDKFFPEYETGKRITVDNLLHMSSGIPDYCNNPDPFWNISGEDAANQKLSDIFLDKISDEEFLQAMYKAPLGFEPGSKFEYSNTNYHLLAFLIEKITGMSYGDYVKENIFDKCGMTKTSSMAKDDMTYQPVGFEELAQYGFTDKDGYPAGPNNYRGDSGMHSCLTDMVKFDRALFAGEFLNEESMKTLLDDVNGYCCGLMKEIDGYSHSGSSFTCMTENRIIESEEFGHIYRITLQRKFVESDPAVKDPSSDPMKGTNYTKGVFANGAYTNEYAGLKIKIPEEFTMIGEEDLDGMMAEAVKSARDKNTKTRIKATNYDAGFWCNGDFINIYFLNKVAGIPDDSDYTEEDAVNDEIKELEGFDITQKDIDKVTLGGQEYLRAAVVMDMDGQEFHVYYYIRKLDDNLMLKVETSSADKKADYFEKLFVE